MPNLPPKHRPATTGVKRHVPVERTTAAKRGYSYKWQQARLGFLAKHPMCAECAKRGLVTEATAVDHIIPHGGDKARFWDSSNWQPICKPCHSKKTAKEDGGFGNTKR